jgi:hypothetical protein
LGLRLRGRLGSPAILPRAHPTDHRSRRGADRRAFSCVARYGPDHRSTGRTTGGALNAFTASDRGSRGWGRGVGHGSRINAGIALRPRVTGSVVLLLFLLTLSLRRIGDGFSLRRAVK